MGYVVHDGLRLCGRMTPGFREWRIPEAQVPRIGVLGSSVNKAPSRLVYVLCSSSSSAVISWMVTHPSESALLTASPREWTAIFS
jgi:hypothetical protein